MSKVTDPAILAQLNAPTKVTDPAILAQLESSSPETELPSGNRFLSGIGGNVLNAVSGAAELLPGVSEHNPIAQAAQQGLSHATGLAGSAGKLIGSVVPYLAMPESLPAQIAASTGIGAITGHGELGERALSGVESGVGAGIGGAIGKAIPYVGTMLKRTIEPHTPTGQEQILSRLLNRAVGENAPDIAERLSAAKTLVPGTAPTAAEIAQSGGLSAVQRFAEQANPEQYAFRRAQNATARAEALSKIAGTAAQKENALLLRDKFAKPFYEAAKQQQVPIDKPLVDLMQRPSMKVALAHAENIAAEQGLPIDPAMKQLIMTGEAVNPQISGDALHTLKIGLDAALKDPKNPLSGAEQNALKGTIKQFEDWRETNIPIYATAQKIYKGLSKPVNQMQIGQTLYNKVKPALTDYGPVTRESANAYASALRDADTLAKKATGFKGATYAGTMTRKQQMTIDAIAQDLARKAAADEAGRGIGSNTFQNFAMQDLAQAAGMPGAALSTLSRVPGLGLIGGAARAAGNAALSTAEQTMKNKLADTLLNPAETARLLKLAQNKETMKATLTKQQLRKIPALIGIGAVNQTNEE